jgi:hypothetical protein
MIGESHGLHFFFQLLFLAFREAGDVVNFLQLRAQRGQAVLPALEIFRQGYDIVAPGDRRGNYFVCLFGILTRCAGIWLDGLEKPNPRAEVLDQKLDHVCLNLWELP